jgi:hypothetical protein
MIMQLPETAATSILNWFVFVSFATSRRLKLFMIPYVISIKIYTRNVVTITVALLGLLAPGASITVVGPKRSNGLQISQTFIEIILI